MIAHDSHAADVACAGALHKLMRIRLWCPNTKRRTIFRTRSEKIPECKTTLRLINLFHLASFGSNTTRKQQTQARSLSILITLGTLLLLFLLTLLLLVQFTAIRGSLLVRDRHRVTQQQEQEECGSESESSLNPIKCYESRE